MGNARSFKRGISKAKALMLVPEIPEDAPAELKNALVRRNQATLTGRCRCGARMRVISPGHAVMEHEPNCIATDDSVSAICERTGWGS